MAITVDQGATTTRRPAKPPVVSVNGTVIPRDLIAREVQHHEAASPQLALEQAARALVVRELLLQEAQRLDIQAVPATDEAERRETEEEALIRTLIEQEVVTPTADDANCQRFYEQNRRRFRSAELFEVAHILLPAAPEDQVRREAAMAQATSIIAELLEQPSAFAAMAKACSACPSAATGGNLGQIGPGQTVPEFEQALRGIGPGAIHPLPVPSRYGIHIVRVDRRIDGQDLPYPLVAEQIAAYLDDSVRRRALRQYLSLLAGRAKVTGVDLAASPSPLVQ